MVSKAKEVCVLDSDVCFLDSGFIRVGVSRFLVLAPVESGLVSATCSRESEFERGCEEFNLQRRGSAGGTSRYSS